MGGAFVVIVFLSLLALGVVGAVAQIRLWWRMGSALPPRSIWRRF